MYFPPSNPQVIAPLRNPAYWGHVLTPLADRLASICGGKKIRVRRRGFKSCAVRKTGFPGMQNAFCLDVFPLVFLVVVSCIAALELRAAQAHSYAAWL